MRSRIHIDCFTSLDDLPKRDHGKSDRVLAVLKKAGRFSVFDIDTDTLASTMESLTKSGRIRTDPDAYGYPWVKVEVVE